MANKHENLTSLFTDIADAIREKTGDTNSITADNFPDAIREIETGSNIETVELYIDDNNCSYDLYLTYTTVNENGDIITISRYSWDGLSEQYGELFYTPIKIVKGTVFTMTSTNYAMLENSNIDANLTQCAYYQDDPWSNSQGTTNFIFSAKINGSAFIEIYCPMDLMPEDPI